MMTTSQADAPLSGALVSGPGHHAETRTTGDLEVGRWTGWIRFGGVLMTIIGAFAAIEGLLAVFSPTIFVTVDGSVLAVDVTAWGWVHVVLGALVLITGVSLLGSAPAWARGVGIGLVGINMLVQLAWLPASPVWSLVMITLDVVVLYALAVTGDVRRTDG